MDRLVEDLWPGTPPETATHAVQVYVSLLRRCLGDAIARRSTGYALEIDPDGVDVHRFARLVHEGHEALLGGAEVEAADTLRAALALWRGPALADFEYEPFAQAEIARLEELRFGALEDRIEADLALGRHAELVPEIEALVEAQPLRERPRALLMRALYLAGRQADALAAYRAARETLVEELGIEPGPELRELEAAILRQDDSLAPAAPRAHVTRTRRLAAVLSVRIDAVADDLEAEEQLRDDAAEAVVAAITRHGGTAERAVDGSVTAIFGVPVAHEDDPLRAARAALEARDAVTAVNGVVLTTGLEAGEVVASERTASGPPLRAAAQLRQEAGEGELLVGEAAVRHLRNVAVFELRDDAAALVELAEPAPAFARRREAPLVGRKRELAALRAQLGQARKSSSARAALVLGPAGIGKSRLASELARRSRGVRALAGRCLSYGDGITYWAVRETAGQAPCSSERDALLGALEAETPPPASEIALLFRRLCEKLAGERPLVVVFDDVHWAEPTLLELIDGVVSRGRGPILVVCAAREELLEEHPEFLRQSERAERLVLDGLSRDETGALLESLGGAALQADTRAQIVETAEGNAFFAEQLLALAQESVLDEHALPETVQALLSARLDRLGPGERAVLERGAVVGREFTDGDVVSLLEPAAAPSASAHLRTLSDRRFVRPRGDDAHAFTHALLQEAVYRSTPKRLRAELHERFADRLDEQYASLPDLDEFVGYHLEQAYRLRTELGESDRRTAQLAEDGGRRLGEAGMRALKRGDMPATVSLLARGVALLPSENEAAYELMSELGIAQHAAGDADAATATFARAIAGAESHGYRRAELRARIEASYERLLRDPHGAARDVLDVAEPALPTFEALADDRSLARAWLLIGYVRGGILGNHAAWAEAEERALTYYRRTAFPPATCLGQIAAALYWGPTPVPRAIERCTELLADATLAGKAAVTPYLGGLRAQLGELAEARRLVTEAERIYHELGALASAAINCGTVLADIELLAGDYPAAERTLREQCAIFSGMDDRSHLGVRAAKLAEALLEQGRLDEAGDWARQSRSHAAEDDLSAQLVLRSVEARLLAWRGLVAEARALAEETVRVADGTDGLNRSAAVRLALVDVLRIAGLESEAERTIEEAVAIFMTKGNVIGASRARELLGHRPPA